MGTEIARGGELMKKKLFSIFLVLVMLAGFASCGKIKDKISLPDEVYEQTPTNENGEPVPTMSPELEGFVNSFDSTDPAEIEQQFQQMLDSETVEVELEFGEELIDDSDSTKVEVELGDNGKPDRSKIQNNYMAIADGDTFTIDFVLKQTTNGEEFVAPIYATCDGEKYYMQATMPYQNKGTMTFGALTMGDGDYYVVLPSMRAYIVLSNEEIGDVPLGDVISGDMIAGDNDSNYVETREVEVNGKKYSCDVYDDEGVTTKYYFTETDLKRVETVDGENITIIEINEVSAKADSSKFTLPQNYFDMTSIIKSGSAMANAAS